jgi:hypothetical protein
MATSIVQIGGAAFAFTRLRFIRALIASCFASVAIVVMSGVATAVISTVHERRSDPIVQDVLVGVMGAFMIIVGVGGLSLLLTVLSRVYRRLLAVASLYPISIFFIMTMGSYGIFFEGLGKWADHQSGVPKYLVGLASGLVIWASFIIFSTLTIEMTLYALWMMGASFFAYSSVRGWRPPVRRIVANFQQQLGFPTFGAFFSRGRLRLVALFFVIAYLNSYFFIILTWIVWLPSRWGGLGPSELDTFGRGILFALVLFSVSILLSLAGVGRLVLKVARRHATGLYQEVREWDARPPIIFLRSFSQDKIRLKVRTRDPMLTFFVGLRRAKQIDEILLETGAPYGPVIAIGDPGDPIPPLGAARIFVPDVKGQWQSVVRRLLKTSSAVVICPALSDSVAWEIAEIQAHKRLWRTIVLANPEMSREEAVRLFEDILHGEGGESFAGRLRPERRPIAAFSHAPFHWTVLVARELSVQTYTVALNHALQSFFGEEPAAPVHKAAATPDDELVRLLGGLSNPHRDSV